MSGAYQFIYLSTYFCATQMHTYLFEWKTNGTAIRIAYI